LNSSDERKRTASIFFDGFGLRPGRTDLSALETFIQEFSSIPWENLTKFLAKVRGEGRIRTPEMVLGQFFGKGTGGTCFSLTDALALVLTEAGFRCRPLMADMNHGRNIHCALLVEDPEGNSYLADPGYLVPRPIPLRPGRSSELELAGGKLVWKPEEGGAFSLYTERSGSSTWRYRIRTDPVSREEFLNHWRSSFHQTGMNSLHINLREDRERLSAHNCNLRREGPGGNSNEKLREDYPGRVQSYFGIHREIAAAAYTEWRKLCQDR